MNDIQKKRNLIRGLNRYFISILQEDIQEFDNKQLDSLLLCLNSKLGMNNQENKKIYEKLKLKSQNNTQNIIKAPLTLQKVNQVIKPTQYYSKIKTLKQTNSIKDTSLQDNIDQSQSFVDVTVINQKIELKGRISDGKMKVEVEVHNFQQKQYFTNIYFTINSTVKNSSLSIDNWKKISKQQINIKKLKEFNYYVSIYNKEHPVRITETENQLGSQFLQDYGAIIQANYREHYRSLKVMLTFD